MSFLPPTHELRRLMAGWLGLGMLWAGLLGVAAVAAEAPLTTALSVRSLSPEEATRALATEFGAAIEVTSGAALEEKFPMIHAVGRASPRAPRLIDLRWGREATGRRSRDCGSAARAPTPAAA